MSTKIDARTTFFFLKLSGLEIITSCASAARFTTVSIEFMLHTTHTGQSMARDNGYSWLVYQLVLSDVAISFV